MRSHLAALLIVAEWLRDGLPHPARGTRRLRELIDLDLALSIIRNAPLAPEDAERIVDILKDRQLIENAVIMDGPGSEAFTTFLERFWDYEVSPYVRERLAHGQRVSRRHCYEVRNRLDCYWAPYFGNDKRLSEIHKSDLGAFSLWLKEEKELKANTINNVLSAGTVPLRWAKKNELISVNPAEGLMTFSGKAAKRGVLTDSEVKKLFELSWSDEHSKIGNMLAMCTGLRAGEIVALQVRDIGEDRLHIRHSWNKWGDLKGTKTDTERSVPIIPSLRDSLRALARRNPHGVGPTTFVFWNSDKPTRPMEADRLVEGLRAALLRLTLSDLELKDSLKLRTAIEYWKNRRVVFHSWRHYFAARMADRLEKRKVMLATGHANGAVFDAYADHSTEETFREVEVAAQDAFGKLLNFSGSGAQPTE